MKQCNLSLQQLHSSVVAADATTDLGTLPWRWRC
jgi:hypothetical protein